MADTREVQGLDGVLELLQGLPSDLVSKKGGVVVAGLFKGGRVIQDAWRVEIDRIIAQPNIGGVYYSTGKYSESVKPIRMRYPKRSGGNEGVRVTVPGRAKYANGTRVAMVAGILEVGHEHMEAKAPMRKAFDSHKEQALAATVKEINDGIQRAIKKRDKRNKTANL